MKRLIIASVIIATLAWSGAAIAAGSSCTQTLTKYVDSVQELVFSCTGDDSTGAYPTMAINTVNTRALYGWYLYGAEYYSGSTVPTTPLIVYCYDSVATSLDIFGGVLASVSTASQQQFNFMYGTGGHRPIRRSCTLNATQTAAATASATFTLKLIFLPIPK